MTTSRFFLGGSECYDQTWEGSEPITGGYDNVELERMIKASQVSRMHVSVTNRHKFTREAVPSVPMESKRIHCTVRRAIHEAELSFGPSTKDIIAVFIEVRSQKFPWFEPLRIIERPDVFPCAKRCR